MMRPAPNTVFKFLAFITLFISIFESYSQAEEQPVYYAWMLYTAYSDKQLIDWVKKYDDGDDYWKFDQVDNKKVYFVRDYQGSGYCWQTNLVYVYVDGAWRLSYIGSVDKCQFSEPIFDYDEGAIVLYSDSFDYDKGAIASGEVVEKIYIKDIKPFEVPKHTVEVLPSASTKEELTDWYGGSPDRGICWAHTKQMDLRGSQILLVIRIVNGYIDIHSRELSKHSQEVYIYIKIGNRWHYTTQDFFGFGPLYAGTDEDKGTLSIGTGFFDDIKKDTTHTIKDILSLSQDPGCTVCHK